MKKEKILFCRCTRMEKEALEKEAGKTQQKVSAYVRERLFYDPRIFDRKAQTQELKKSMDDLVYQVRKIGVNINQIARSNNAGFFNAKDLETLEKRVEELEERINKAVQELEKEGG